MSARHSRRPDHGPIVGVTAGRAPSERYSLHEGYVKAIVAAGGFPVILPVGPDTEVDRFLSQVLACDALLLSGGGDVDPELWISNTADARGVDRARDDGEIAAIHATLASGRPVLGIARGLQVLAVAFGGTLIGDVERAGLEKHDHVDHEDEGVHAIRTEPGSLAETILGDVHKVNSTHHQAVASVPEGLRATAWAPDACIEAIEGPGVLAVQWHPERLANEDERLLAAFRWLIS